MLSARTASLPARHRPPRVQPRSPPPHRRPPPGGPHVPKALCARRATACPHEMCRPGRGAQPGANRRHMRIAQATRPPFRPPDLDARRRRSACKRAGLLHSSAGDRRRAASARRTSTAKNEKPLSWSASPSERTQKRLGERAREASERERRAGRQSAPRQPCAPRWGESFAFTLGIQLVSCPRSHRAGRTAAAVAQCGVGLAAQGWSTGSAQLVKGGQGGRVTPVRPLGCVLRL